MSRSVLNRIVRAGAVVSVLAGLGSSAPAQDPAPSEQQVKAAFLYNFVKFVEWPATALPPTNNPILIGVLSERLFNELEPIVRNKTVESRALGLTRNSGEFSRCQIVFIGAEIKEARVKEVLRNLKDSSVLTVGEMDAFWKSGGMINFVMDENRVRFEINMKAATGAGLKISPRLRRLALRESGP